MLITFDKHYITVLMTINDNLSIAYNQIKDIVNIAANSIKPYKILVKILIKMLDFQNFTRNNIFFYYILGQSSNLVK